MGWAFYFSAFGALKTAETSGMEVLTFPRAETRGRNWSFGEQCVPKLEFGNEGAARDGALFSHEPAELVIDGFGESAVFGRMKREGAAVWIANPRDTQPGDEALTSANISHLL